MRQRPVTPPHIGFGAVQAPAPSHGVLGAQARAYAGRIRLDYILGEDGLVLYGEDGNSLIKDG